MGKASQFIPALKYGHKIYPEDMATPLTFSGKYWYVDKDNGSDTANTGRTIDKPKATIQAAITAAGAHDVIFVKAANMAAGATDPVSYAETLSIGPTQSGLSLIGINTGRAQGSLPQIKKGSGSTALLTIQAPGCLITGFGFNGGSSTGGGILLDDDGSTKSAFGTSIIGNHFKNCVGSSATNAATGGAIQWASTGNAWQTHIAGNVFYKNVGDIVLLGTSGSVPQDVIIEDNEFLSASTSATDANLFLSAGSGMSGLIIRNNAFGAVPALGGGTNAKYLSLTGCYGAMTGNHFGSNGRTFGAAANELVPTTVFMAANYQEKSTSGSGEIFRT